MLAEVWRTAKETFAPVTIRPSAQEKRLELMGGGVVDMWSMEKPDAARGRKYKRVIIDEAAMIPSLKDAWDAVIRPTLTDLIGDAYFMSTPKGLNDFWQLFQRGQDDAFPDWSSWQIPTSANPYIDPNEIEAARRELPERTFQQEYLARFLEFEGAVFRNVTAAVNSGIVQMGPLQNHEYVIGVDWGKIADFTVFAVVDVTIGALVYLDRFNRIDYTVQSSRLGALYEKFKTREYPTVIAESNSMGEPIIDQLRRDGIAVRSFVTTNQSKARIIESLQIAFERGEIEIIDNAILTNELMAFEATPLATSTRYAAPPGMHDDTVIALAIAWQGKRDSGSGWAAVADVGHVEGVEDKWGDV